MEWEEPKTDWAAASIPAPKDFNRIENNIKELKSYDKYVETLLGNSNNVNALPIANGGTGTTNPASARSNLGIKEFSSSMACYLSSNSGDAKSCNYSSSGTVNFKGVCIGNTIICSGCIDIKTSEDKWIKIYTRYNVISVIASVKKASSNNYAPECVCYCDGKYAYVTSDERTSDGFYVTLTLTA